MGDPPLQEPDDGPLAANLAALAAVLPRSAEIIRQAGIPPGVRPAIGRDGSPTYQIDDGPFGAQWLGRTSMPSISSEALVEAFDAGGGNALFFGLGQGAEARLLLRKLRPHQAVMVVDERPWAISLALRLHDFSAELRRGRLLLFVGEDGWNLLRDYLRAHSGYLEPQRILSWPWFDAAAIGHVTRRLSEINSEITWLRMQRRGEMAESLRHAPPEEQPQRPAMAILSSSAEPGSLRMADALQHAAEGLGWPVTGLVPDTPAMLHPCGVEEQLAELRPSICLLIDGGPETLACRLPPVKVFVLFSHGQPLDDAWLARLSAEIGLGVPTRSQAVSAVAQGRKASKVIEVPPAVHAAPDESRSGGRVRGDRILVIGDWGDPSASAAGIHLPSHCRLWDAAAAIIRRRCDSYTNDHAEDVLREAEKRLEMKLDSAQVRQGLAGRIRWRLGGAIVAGAYCEALAEEGVDFDTLGPTRLEGSGLAERHRGSWPDRRQLHAVVYEYGAVIPIGTSGMVSSFLLETMSLGLACLVRKHSSDETPDGLGAMLDIRKHLWRFDSRAELLKVVRRLRVEPDEFECRAKEAAAHLRGAHTWGHRLSQIVQACWAE